MSIVRTQTRTTTSPGVSPPDSAWTVTADNYPKGIPVSTLYDDFNQPDYTILHDGDHSPNGKWLSLYGGYGLKGVSNGVFFQYPKTDPTGSVSTMTLTTQPFKDFEMTFRMKTVNQLHASPKAWEVGWFFWHFSDNWHNYAAVLKTSGFQVEKKDNNSQSDTEIFLVTNSAPKLTVGVWNNYKLRVTNSASNTPRIQIWVDGNVAVDFIDNSIHQPNSAALQNGYIGFYCEDSVINFDDVYITPI